MLLKYFVDTLAKPHVIKRHKTFNKDGTPKPDQEHRVFVRKGPSIYVANKYDLDFMYYDRKNITPDHEVFVYCTTLGMQLNILPSEIHNNNNITGSIHGHIAMTFENTGRRPVDIDNLTFDLIISEEPSNPDSIHFSSKQFALDSGTLIRSNDMATLIVYFFSHPIKDFTMKKADDRLNELNGMLRHLKIKNIEIFTRNNFKILARI